VIGQPAVFRDLLLEPVARLDLGDSADEDVQFVETGQIVHGVADVEVG